MSTTTQELKYHGDALTLRHTASPSLCKPKLCKCCLCRLFSGSHLFRSILDPWKPSSCHIQSPALRIPHQLYLRVQLMVARCRTSPSVPRLRRCIRSWPHTKTILPTNGQGPNWLLKTYGDGHKVIFQYIIFHILCFRFEQVHMKNSTYFSGSRG